MGYESKIYIIEKRRNSDYGSVVAMMDLCKFDYDSGFHDLFVHPIDFDAYYDDGNTLIKEDRYNTLCHYAYLEDVMKWLKPYYKEKKRQYGKHGMYRRLRPMYNLLKSYNNGQWITNKLKNPKKNILKEENYYDILVLHYGY